MYSRAFLLFLGASALLGITTVRAHAAWAYTPCGNTRLGWNPECCYYGYCSSSRQCWVTETGMGVCAFVRYDRAQRRYRVVNERRR
jgi:hypothetical protein